MKRYDDASVSHPKLRGRRRDVAGGLSTHALSHALALDVASDRLAKGDPLAHARAEAELIADFADFLTAERGAGQDTSSTAARAFRERLRGRLWRSHVLTCVRGRVRGTQH